MKYSRQTALAAASLFSIWIFSCNKGGVTANDQNPSAPSNLTYSQPIATYVVGKPISPNAPKVTGTVTSYSVSPALPAGLSFNVTTGAISGTPTAAVAARNYIVTATNNGGLTTVIVNIATYSNPPGDLFYDTPVVYEVGSAIYPNIPYVIGIVAKYSVSPTLPIGLLLDSTTGAISGTPVATSVVADYTITATNELGSTKAIVNIAVKYFPPSALSYTTPVTYAVGLAVASNVPTVSGLVTGYSVNPSLPAGLSLDATTGVISGTPTAMGAAVNYTVTASNPGGSTTTIVKISLYNAPPSALSYPTPISYAVGKAITSNAFLTNNSNMPTVTGIVTHYSVSPNLSAGILLDSSTGAISGTPTANAAAANYTISATNRLGSTTAIVNIAVDWTYRALMGPSSVVWTGTQLVAVGAGRTIETSPDGVTWTERNSGMTISYGLHDVIWTGTQLVVVGEGGTILTSPDGVTWTTRNSGASEYFSSIAWSGGKLVVVGLFGGILTSPDGITWTVVRQPHASPDWSFNSVTWSGTLFVAGGSFNGAGIVTSPDGVIWTSRTGGGGYVKLAGTHLVSVGTGTFSTSPDGVTWTTRSTGYPGDLFSITWTGNQYVAIGGNVIVTSPDGVTWSSRISPRRYDHNCDIIWTGSQLVLVGMTTDDLEGAIMTSP